jgi:hypothetical protein
VTDQVSQAFKTGYGFIYVVIHVLEKAGNDDSELKASSNPQI